MRASSAAAQLKDIVGKKTCPGCLVLTSSDRTRRERALAYVLENAAGRPAKPPSFAFGDQGRQTIQGFLAECAEPSLFEPTRFGVIRSIERAKAVECEPISALIAKQLAGVHLIVLGESLPNSPNFKKALDKHAVHVAFEDLKGAEISRWVEKELRYAGAAQAPDQVIAEIIAVGGEDPDAIARLVEKLSLFVDGSQPSVADVRAIDPGRSAASDFALADALVGPKRANAEVLCQQLLSQGSSPFMLIGLLAKTFTTLYRIRAALDRGQGQQEIRNDLGTSPWLFSKYLPLAKQLSLPQLAARLDALLEADFRMKDRSLGASALFSSLASDFSPSSRSPFT